MKRLPKKKIAKLDIFLEFPEDGKKEIEWDEIQLWEEIRKGNTKALTLLYNVLYPRLYKFGLKISSDETLTKDVIQEIFYKIWNKQKELPQVKMITPYLFQWMKWAIQRVMSKEYKKVGIDKDFLEKLDPIPSQESLMLKNASQLEKKAKVEHLMEMLTKRQKEIIYLRFFENCTYEEIEDITNLKYQVIRNIVYQAMKLFRSHLHIIVIILPTFFYLFFT